MASSDPTRPQTKPGASASQCVRHLDTGVVWYLLWGAYWTLTKHDTTSQSAQQRNGDVTEVVGLLYSGIRADKAEACRGGNTPKGRALRLGGSKQPEKRTVVAGKAQNDG